MSEIYFFLRWDLVNVSVLARLQISGSQHQRISAIQYLSMWPDAILSPFILAVLTAAAFLLFPWRLLCIEKCGALSPA